MKIVHVGNYNYSKSGNTYYSMESRIHQGLVRNSHFVYAFSYRDIARCSTIFNSKKWGIKKTNKELIKVCLNINPDLLLLSHAELISFETLSQIKKELPDIKIAMWFVDALFNERNIKNIESKISALDILFVTTGGKWLNTFSNKNIKVFFFPNMVDSSIDIHQNYLKKDLPIDFIFCGTDGSDIERREFLIELKENLSSLNVQFCGCLNEKPLYGAQYINLLGKVRMGLNYSRRNDVELYSSDRIAHLTGAGILTFTPRIPGYEEIYTEDEVVYFFDIKDLIEKILYYKVHLKEAQEIAYRGWLKAHTHYNSTKVTEWMLKEIFENKDLNHG